MAHTQSQRVSSRLTKHSAWTGSHQVCLTCRSLAHAYIPEYLVRRSRPPPSTAILENKIDASSISANLNGIRSASSKGFSVARKTDADFICLQELRPRLGDLTAEMLNPSNYYGHFHFAEKKAIAGSASMLASNRSRLSKPGVTEIDVEARYLELSMTDFP